MNPEAEGLSGAASAQRAAVLRVDEAARRVARGELLKGKPALPGGPALVDSVAGPLAALMLAALRQRPSALTEASAAELSQLARDRLPQALLQRMSLDDAACWQLTFELVHQALRKSLPGAAVANSPDDERLTELRQRALANLDGGRKVVSTFARSQGDGDFLRYLRRSVRNAADEQLRLKNDIGRGFWRGKVPQLDTRSGTQGDGVVLVGTGLGEPGRGLNRAWRAAERQRAAHHLLEIARGLPGGYAKTAQDYLEWLLQLPLGEDASQAAFSRASGVAKGTVNSHLHRFRGHLQDNVVLPWDRDGLYTTAGG